MLFLSARPIAPSSQNIPQTEKCVGHVGMFAQRKALLHGHRLLQASLGFIQLAAGCQNEGQLSQRDLRMRMVSLKKRSSECECFLVNVLRLLQLSSADVHGA